MLAHDLRTPMSAVSHGLRILEPFAEVASSARTIAYMKSANTLCESFLSSILHNMKVVIHDGALIPEIKVQNVEETILGVVHLMEALRLGPGMGSG